MPSCVVIRLEKAELRPKEPPPAKELPCGSMRYNRRVPERLELLGPARSVLVKKSSARGAGCSVSMLVAIAAVAAGLSAAPARGQQPSREQLDNFTWLEDIHGDRPMAWVKAEDTRTAALIENDPHF